MNKPKKQYVVFGFVPFEEDFFIMKLKIIFLLCSSILLGVLWFMFHNDQKSQSVMIDEKSFYLINVLDKEVYDDAHIVGSIHVPYEKIKSYLKKILNKDALLIFYCSNYYCTASDSAAMDATNLGFKNVFVYKGGMAEWYQTAQHDKDFLYDGPAKLDYLKFVIIPDNELDMDIIFDEEAYVEKKYAIISIKDLQKILKDGTLIKN